MNRRTATLLATTALVATAATGAGLLIARTAGVIRTHAGRAEAADERLTEVRTRVTAALNTRLSGKGLHLGDPVFIRTFKEESLLELFVRDRGSGKFRLFEEYPIANWGGGTLGPKLKEGDGQAPEGFYFVPRGRMNPASDYHLAFNLGFPNDYDRRHGRTGSFLMVHGAHVSIGCYAMTDPQIEEIYLLTDAALKKGEPFFRVHCFPFRMTAGRIESARADGSPWAPFWANLKGGSDWFEKHGVPPDVGVDRATGKYTFGKPAGRRAP